MKRNIAKFSVVALILLLPAVGLSKQLNEWLFGKWAAQSAGTVAVHGDMEIRKGKIYWSRQGSVKYRIVSESKAYVLVELEYPTSCGKFDDEECEQGCGKILRFAPYPNARSIDSLQMFEYPSLKDVVSEGDAKSGACAWGWYIRSSN